MGFGVVLERYTCRDGLVRSVKLWTPKGHFIQPIEKLWTPKGLVTRPNETYILWNQTLRKGSRCIEVKSAESENVEPQFATEFSEQKQVVWEREQCIALIPSHTKETVTSVGLRLGIVFASNILIALVSEGQWYGKVSYGARVVDA